MIYARVAAVAALLMGSMSLSAQGTFGIRGRTWWADPDGDIEFEDNPPDANNLDVTSDLGLGDPKIFYNITGYLVPTPAMRFSLDYLRGGYNESATAPRPVIFDKSVFPAGTRVKSDFDIQRFELFMDQPIWQGGGDGGVYSSFGFIWADVDVRLSGPAGGSSDSVDGIFPIAGFHADIPLFGYFRGIGRIAYTQMKIGKTAINSFELEGGVSVLFGGSYGVEAGYRLWRMDLFNEAGSLESREVDMTLSGPFLGVTLLF